jgi:hypothetical protein
MRPTMSRAVVSRLGRRYGSSDFVIEPLSIADFTTRTYGSPTKLPATGDASPRAVTEVPPHSGDIETLPPPQVDTTVPVSLCAGETATPSLPMDFVPIASEDAEADSEHADIAAAPPDEPVEGATHAAASNAHPEDDVLDVFLDSGGEEGVGVDVLSPVAVDCVRLSYVQHADLDMPRQVIRADGTPITSAAVNALLEFSTRVLERGERHAVLWDLRQCGAPQMSHVWSCLRWAGGQKRNIDTLVACMCICLSGGALRGVVNFVLSVARPPMPRLVCSTNEEAWAFVREKCPSSSQTKVR